MLANLEISFIKHLYLLRGIFFNFFSVLSSLASFFALLVAIRASSPNFSNANKVYIYYYVSFMHIYQAEFMLNFDMSFPRRRETKYSMQTHVVCAHPVLLNLCLIQPRYHPSRTLRVSCSIFSITSALFSLPQPTGCNTCSSTVLPG